MEAYTSVRIILPLEACSRVYGLFFVSDVVAYSTCVDIKKKILFQFLNSKILETSKTRFLLLFPKFKKMNISTIYKAIILIFLVNLSMVVIYNFVKINFIHPQGEPIEHHLGDIQPIKLILLNTVKRTGRVDILWCIFEKIAKKFKMKDKKNNILVNIS